MKNKLYYIIFSIALFSCTPTRVIKPLAKGEKSIQAHLGGPLIGFGNATIPIPFTSFCYAQGVNNKITAFGSLHTTSTFFGVIQTDLGACANLYKFKHDKFDINLSASPALQMAFDKWEKKFKAWPQLDFNFYASKKDKPSFVYIGMMNWFELAKYKAHDIKQTNHWIFAPQLGYNYSHKKMNYALEMKYLAPNKNNQPNVVDYRGFNHKGAIGVYLSFTYKFNTPKNEK